MARRAVAPKGLAMGAPALRPLAPTPLLNLEHPTIEYLAATRGWRQLPAFERFGAIYDFVRNEIAFG